MTQSKSRILYRQYEFPFCSKRYKACTKGDVGSLHYSRGNGMCKIAIKQQVLHCCSPTVYILNHS